MDSSEYHSICDFLSNSIYPDDLERANVPSKSKSNFMRKTSSFILEETNRLCKVLSYLLSSIRKAI